ncbi:Protein srek1IP1 [Irineochytrium annulatum]|nr:Protein srek1IP1 [Irineochytrium annulatum]
MLMLGANNPAAAAAAAVAIDPVKAEEIARTIYAGNITTMISEPEITACFAACGPIAQMKLVNDPVNNVRFAFIEFATVEAAIQALQLNGQMIGERVLKVNPSKTAIVKTAKKLDDATARRIKEVEDRIAQREAAKSESQRIHDPGAVVGGHDPGHDRMGPGGRGAEATAGTGIGIAGMVVIDRRRGFEIGTGIEKGSENETGHGTGTATGGRGRGKGGGRGQNGIFTTLLGAHYTLALT